MLLTKKNTNFLESAITRVSVLDHSNKEEGLQFLIRFFNEIRPRNESGKENPETNLQHAIRLLHEYPLLLTNLRHALFTQLTNWSKALKALRNGEIK